MKDLKKDRFNKLEEVLIEFLDSEIGVWFSVRKKSLANMLKSNGFNKKMASTLLKNLLSANVIEKRGVTSATEYKVLREPTNFNEIIENSFRDYSVVRNQEYIFGKQKLELGKKYFMVFNKKIFEVQVIGVKIKKNKEIVYDVKKPITSQKSKYTILKNIDYKNIFLTVTSAGDEVKNIAVKECRFIMD